MRAVYYLSALEQARLLKQRKISARELLKLSRERVEKYNPAINAVIVSDFARAEKAAAASDRRLKRGEPRGIFDGVPMTIKESFDWQGTPSTWGAPALRNTSAARSPARPAPTTTTGSVAAPRACDRRTNGEAAAADILRKDRRSMVLAARRVPDESKTVMGDHFGRGSKLISVEAGEVGTTGRR